MPDITMPRLSDSMEEGTILKWLKAEGDDVSKGEELVEIETDKATMTYESDADGTLEIVADEGATLAIGEVIARIGEGGGSASEGSGQEEAEKEAGAEGEDSSDGGGTATKTSDEEEQEDEEGGDEGGDEEPEEEPAAEKDEPEPEAKAEPEAKDESERAPSAEGNGGRPKASPVARRIAREHDIDLSTLEGSGRGGGIAKPEAEPAAAGAGDKDGAEEEPEAREAEPAAEEQAPEAEPEREREKAPAGETGKGDVSVEEPSRIQQIIARRMAESKATIPHFTLSMDVDMEGAVELRNQ